MYRLQTSLMFFVLTLFGCAPSPDGQGGGGGIVSTILMFGLIGGIVYLIVRVAKRKKQPKVKRVKRKTDNNDTV